MGNQGEKCHNIDEIVRKRKWKSRLSVAAAIFAVVAVSVVSVGNYMRTRQADSTSETDEFNQQRAQGGFLDTVMASGTTSVGVDAVTFEIDFLEDTSLYVEEVYLSNGDTVQAGDKYIKFTEESISDARAELQAAALSASLAYRNGVIANGESKLQAQYTYDAAMLEAQYAQLVYEDTVAELEAKYTQAVTSYEEAQKEYNTYYESVQNDAFYEEYDIPNLKKAYEEAHDLYTNRKAYWEVSDAELESGSSDSIGMTLGGGAGSKKEQDAESDRKWIIKTVILLQEEMEKAEENYEKALKDYEQELDSAELTLQKLFNQLETAREDYTDAEIAYQKGMLSAKTAYETATAKGTIAQNDYDTQLTSLSDNLDRLQDVKEETQRNLALFEKLVGDGYLYTKEAGTILMVVAQKGQPLTGGSAIFAYSNPEELSVSVSVSQNDIAKLYVGEAANVMISEYGNYHGVIETINPVSASNSRTSVSYTVTVHLEGDVGSLTPNLTANVIFEDKELSPIFEEKENENGRSERNGKEASDKAD